MNFKQRYIQAKGVACLGLVILISFAYDKNHSEDFRFILVLRENHVINIMTTISLIQKYNVPGPRYTSYPTVPFWKVEQFTEKAWIESLQKSFAESNHQGISLYIHLPYCESLCTFCGCNKRITKNHSVEEPYIDALLKEWDMYTALLSETPRIAEIHFGGGTPSFFKPNNLARLVKGILAKATLADEIEFGFEGHPGNTTAEHLEVLHQLGFTRVSYGVQDYDLRVQTAIHRFQPFEQVKQVTELSRKLGYSSISHDLVFGLPFQTLASIEDTIQKTIALKPDRIAFYSYAHVPWIKGNGQRGFKDEDLPSPALKRQLYEKGRAMLEANGYFEIGMDHFALSSDSMYVARQNGTLNRNFMGYTTTQTKVMIGLGVSSISDSWTAFAQNVKEIETYMDSINQNKLPLHRGHILNQEDLKIREQILNLICRFKTSWDTDTWTFEEKEALFERLQPFIEDDLIVLHDNGVEVLEAGKTFIRNICMAFDMRMIRENPQHRLFSQTI
ncbi:oxygen-independent coproporphyrinogen III oxidase [Flectobacillus sp. BAB-3569]|uniref:oxygen-independent coproporphyrinogen III oxidase n=1 Tax=Flectobacillus sp. BAB-3569 TaxID=1509483 RepID=UPI0026BC8BFE|nr:oxygen-independent coproporphyrinogen III oxidase [Flectobacillus sp. BAB-3569]